MKTRENEMKREEKSMCFPCKKPPLQNEHLYPQVQGRRKKPRSKTRRAPGAGGLQAASRSWVWEHGELHGADVASSQLCSPCPCVTTQSQLQHVHYTDTFVRQEQMCPNQDSGLCCSSQAVGAFLNTQDLKLRKMSNKAKRTTQ